MGVRRTSPGDVAQKEWGKALLQSLGWRTDWWEADHKARTWRQRKHQEGQRPGAKAQRRERPWSVQGPERKLTGTSPLTCLQHEAQFTALVFTAGAWYPVPAALAGSLQGAEEWAWCSVSFFLRMYPLLESYPLTQCRTHLRTLPKLWIRRLTAFITFFSLEPRNSLQKSKKIMSWTQVVAEGEPWVPDGLLDVNMDVGICYEGEGHMKEGDSEVSDFNPWGMVAPFTEIQ